jgi:hypothetical protein
MRVCFPDPGLPDPQAIGTMRSVRSRILGRDNVSLESFGNAYELEVPIT